jgi:hypothetical protein
MVSLCISFLSRLNYTVFQNPFFVQELIMNSVFESSHVCLSFTIDSLSMLISVVCILITRCFQFE